MKGGRLLSYLAVLAAVVICGCVALEVHDPHHSTWVANGDDEVDVYLLEGIVSMFDGSALAKKLHIFHGGVGFVNLNTKEECQCEFYAYPAFVSAILPKVDKSNDSLEWLNHAIVDCRPFINYTQWRDGEVTKVGETSGDVYNKFVTWGHEEYNVQHPWYYLFQVRHLVEDRMILASDTCFDYVSAGFEKLASYGMKFDDSIVYKREDVYLYVLLKPEVADYDDSHTRKEMLTFYETFDFSGDSVWEDIKKVLIFFPDSKFVYQHEVYYKFHPEMPYVLPHYHREPLPGQKVGDAEWFEAKSVLELRRE